MKKLASMLLAMLIVLFSGPARPGEATAASLARDIDASQGYIWHRSGPIAGSITALAIDPHFPAILYLGTDREGVFKSTDSGENWVRRNNGLDSLNVSELLINPQTRTTLYAGTNGGVYKSLDGGDHWASFSVGLTNANVTGLVIHPTMPDRLFVSTFGGGVFRSDNAGLTWSTVNTGLNIHYVHALAIDPLEPDTLYAGTEYLPPPPAIPAADLDEISESLFKTTNGGDTWTVANSGLPEHCRVQALAIDPSDPDTLYAGVVYGSSALYRSVDGAVTWEPIGADLPMYGNTVMTLVIDAKSPSTLYAGTSDLGIFKSTNHAENWAPINTGQTASSILALAIDPATSAILYTGGAERGLFKSINEGGAWREIHIDMAFAPIFSLAADPESQGAIFTGSQGSIYRSVDDGVHWNSLDAIMGCCVSVSAMVIDPPTPSTIYAGAGSYLLVSNDGGMIWGISIFNFNADIWALAMHPPILYIGTGGNGAFRSMPGGDWEQINNGLDNHAVRALVIDPVSSNILYAGTYGGVYKSSDGGDQWDAVNEGLTNPIVFTLAIDPLSPDILYAGTPDGVFKTTNSGDEWNMASTGLPAGTFITTLVIDPLTPETLYAGTGGSGVYQSLDSGAHWAAYNSGLTAPNIQALAIAPSSPPTLYAGTDDGVFITRFLNNRGYLPQVCRSQ